MTVSHRWENLAPLLELQERKPWPLQIKPLPMEYVVTHYSLDTIVKLHQCVIPKLREVPYHVVHEFIGRKYNKVKERMEKGTREDDESAENVGEPMICAICSDECKRTEERAYMNCGHTYHFECYRTKRMANCLVCGQELLSFLSVAEGESIFW